MYIHSSIFWSLFALWAGVNTGINRLFLSSFAFQSSSSNQLITWPQLFVDGPSLASSGGGGGGGGGGEIINMEDDDVEQEGAGTVDLRHYSGKRLCNKVCCDELVCTIT